MSNKWVLSVAGTTMVCLLSMGTAEAAPIGKTAAAAFGEPGKLSTDVNWGPRWRHHRWGHRHWGYRPYSYGYAPLFSFRFGHRHHRHWR